MKPLSLFFILLSLSLISVAQTPAYVSSDSLFGWWSFNGNVNDFSGNGNHGSNNGATLTNDRFGNSNSAYNFDGHNDYITINQFFDRPERSIFLWMNLDSITGSLQAIFGIDHFNLNNGHTLISADSNLNLMMNVGFPGYPVKSVSLNTWYHVGCTRSSDSTKLYINGMVYQTFANGNLRSMHGNNPNIRLGTSRLNDRFFSGTVDDFGIWNRALDSCEVKNLYNSSLNNCSITTGLNEVEKVSYTIFPNPTEGILNISLTQNAIGGNFILVDMLGREVISQLINNNSFQINMSHLNLRGTFVVRITDQKSHLILQEKIIYK